MAIGDMANEYWDMKAQKTLLHTLKGISACSDFASKNVLDISGNAGDAGIFNTNAMIDAIYKLGDKQDSLTAVMMNSAVMKELVKKNLIDTIRDADGKILYQTYLEKRVIVDDGLAPFKIGAEGSQKNAYEMYFFGQGAVSYTIDTENTEIETDRDSLANDDLLIMRRYFVMHPRGMSWVGKPTGITPTNAELAVGTNWEMADHHKNIAITKLIARID